jgi:hypothetical protein
MRSRQSKKIAAGDLGCYDGPPIWLSNEDYRDRQRIIRASERLASTINFLGLRP